MKTPKIKSSSVCNGERRRQSLPSSSRLETLPNSLLLLEILDPFDQPNTMWDSLKVILSFSSLEVPKSAICFSGVYRAALSVVIVLSDRPHTRTEFG